MMAFWTFWVVRVLPGVVAGAILGVAGYIRLHFEKKWPFWGRTQRGDS
jgi:hypothetical protein